MVYSAGLHLIIVIISNKLWMIQQPSAGRKQQVINIDLLRGWSKAIDPGKAPPDAFSRVRMAMMVERSFSSLESKL